MSRYDEMQSNHPQANTPWAGQTKANETRSNGGSGWPMWGRIVVDRGAPLIVGMFLYLALGAWNLLGALDVVNRSSIWVSIVVLIFVVYSYPASSWSLRLWRTRWTDRELRGAVPERILVIIGGAALLAGLIPYFLAPLLWLSVLAFSIQLAAFVVLVPLTLRRYPGFA